MNLEQAKVALQDYVDTGKLGSKFLRAVLSNDLFTAVHYEPDGKDAADLRAVAMHVYWELPAGCWGSIEKIHAWQDRKRRAT